MNNPDYPYYVPQFGIGSTPDPFPGTGFDEAGNPNLSGGGGGGTSNFNQLTNRPKYGNTVMTGSTNIPTVPTKLADLTDGAEVATLAENLAAETKAREDADENLQQSVTNNTSDITANTALISGLTKDIDTLESTVATNKVDADNAVLAEAAARENADNAIKADVTANTQSITSNSNEIGGIKTQLSKTIQLDTTVTGNGSTVTLTKTTGSLNEDSQTATDIALPVASATSAGVMNPATYNAVQENSELISSILNGAVAVEGLPAAPTQEELTTAWKSATSETELINRASIFDTTNQKVWYYYANISAWQATSSDGSQVSVSQATNTSLGIVKGSTEEGQVAVEADGTMSVNGYDDLKTKVDNSETRTTNLPSQVVYNTSLPEPKADEVDLTLVMKDLHTGGDATLPLNIMGATTAQAGVMTTTQVAQLNSNTSNINSLSTQLTALNTQVTDIQKDADEAVSGVAMLETDKQDKLVSGTNIKTINGTSILGEGDIVVEGGSNINLLDSYNETPKAGDVYEASYVNALGECIDDAKTMATAASSAASAAAASATQVSNRVDTIEAQIDNIDTALIKINTGEGV